MNHVTVATLGLGRPAHLANMMRGLAQQTQPPCELVVALMGGTRYDDLPDVPFPVQMIEVREAGLRLSAARNAAVATARGDVLAFWTSTASRARRSAPTMRRRPTVSTAS